MPGVGFEPTRPRGQSGLSRPRLTEFRHPGATKPTRGRRHGRRLKPDGTACAGPARVYKGAVAKILFIPVSITAGLVAGVLGKKLFDGLWGVIDDEEPPDSKHRDISWGRLLLAGAIQGAIFRAVKEATDHASRRAFYRTTGTWPGEKRPDPE